MSRTIPAPPPEIKLSPIPNVRKADGAAEWITDTLGIPVTEQYIRDKTNRKQISYWLIRGVRHYSTQALYDFIMSQQEVGS
ncbi:hypothetical protein [Mycolicibacterium fortuitum]|uniref:hypothetical protein n=1 Tax=Mycolicibacterium fortuitum TaxID=1766 RepID=UPI000AD6825B|nr:hypothetical protein [Mycolicibacterium fortuitum]NOQ62523.1 hypothetical protein [Mycolicibacterium fortuitum]